MALLPPATQSSSPWCSSLTSSSFRKALALLHPSLLLCSFLYSFTPHPPSVVPSPNSASFISPHAVQFSPIKTSSRSPYPFSFSLSHSLSLLCFIIHCVSPPPRAPPCTKNLPPAAALCGHVCFFVASQLICQLVSLNCLWIYNLAWRECVWASSADKICILCLRLNQIWLRLRGVADLLLFMRASVVAHGFRGSLVAFVTMAECEQMLKCMTRIYGDGMTALTKISSVLFYFLLVIREFDIFQNYIEVNTQRQLIGIILQQNAPVFMLHILQ